MELDFAGGAWLLCGLGFLATPAMRKRRRCRGIISPSFFHSLMAIYSDVNREAGKTCPGSRAGASSSSSGDDVVGPVNLEKGVLW
jgi:hypothetical protein